MNELGRYLEAEAYPRLSPDDVYTHTSHAFQRSGDRLRGGCPFHESASGSSFVVSTDHERLPWWCEGCQEGGDPVKYLHSLRAGRWENPTGADFIEAARAVCELAGVPFPERETSDPERAARLGRLQERAAVLEAVVEACEAALWMPEHRHALAYVRGRGLSDEAIRGLRLGFYPSRRHVAAALAGRFEREPVDYAAVLTPQLEGYVVVPWRDERGRMLTLYGRFTGSPPEGRPKTYALPNPTWEGTPELESKRSPLLFDRVRAAGHRRIVAVEGVFDALCLQAAGASDVCAYVAASFSGAQLDTLRRCGVQAVTVVPDPDGGGVRGAASSVRRLLAAGLDAFVPEPLPEGMDPDEFVRARGLAAWRAHVASAELGGRHVALAAVEKLETRKGDPVDLATPQGRAEALQAGAAALTGLPPLHIEAGSRALAERFATAPETVRALIPDAPPPDEQTPADGGDVSTETRRVPAASEPEPLPWCPFPVEALPPAVASYVRAHAAALDADPAFVAVPALAALAAAVGNSYRVRLKRSWEEIAALWAVVVADSGSGKSPALQAALEPVFRMEREARERYEQERELYETERQEYEARPKKERGAPPLEPARQRYRVGDTTVESLVFVHEQNPRGLLLARDELAGWLGSFDRYARGESDLQAWIEMHGGRPVVVDRKSSEQPVLMLDSPNVSAAGTIQPDVIRRQLTPLHLGSGFAARLLLAEPPTRPKRWTDADVTPDVSGAYHRLIRDLYALPYAPAAGPAALELTPEARAAFAAFVNENGERQHALPSGPLKAALSKHEALAARLALTFHLADCVSAGVAPCPVSGGAMERAVLLARWFRYETARLYDRYEIEAQAVDRDARLAAALPETFGWQDVREAWELKGKSGAYVVVHRLLEKGLAEDAGHGRFRRLAAKESPGGLLDFVDFDTNSSQLVHKVHKSTHPLPEKTAGDGVPAGVPVAPAPPSLLGKERPPRQPEKDADGWAPVPHVRPDGGLDWGDGDTGEGLDTDDPFGDDPF